ncbi:MAG: hypothetical protein A2846_00445 [Candidatus Doudnabacteria bacterium RIFCSPHIGHO2_01_FULL_49_9]|uniref:Uncharacterized protein n=1 Tax=Candidatus Doudnabacteria bacterium RIFCSPHIGHO2_01_FULL_49_9 TaxID=1817827 RepID=A0A1F5NY84_9BACT|nr:MAG: hypothetical protein A2846_00445 [Candidatus Doudnabacteria bacterium RIFCSPHIGHO2_01_FULL_49_9]
MTQDEIEKSITEIMERNRRVEIDKAWEISWTRRLFITAATYAVAGIWLVLIDESSPWLKALVPAAGYILSTLSLPFIKNWWSK